VQLQPRRPPGRIDRKAAAYASEICRLRSEGYTYEAIREAMADVGIELSTSALRREVRRFVALPAAATSAPPPAVVRVAPCPPHEPPPAPTVDPAGLSSRDLADAFFEANPSNALRASKDTP
jgi:hypothetical protein